APLAFSSRTCLVWSSFDYLAQKFVRPPHWPAAKDKTARFVASFLPWCGLGARSPFLPSVVLGRPLAHRSDALRFAAVGCRVSPHSSTGCGNPSLASRMQPQVHKRPANLP